MDRDKVLVSEIEAGKLLGLCSKTVYHLRKRGELPFVAVGTAIRYRVDALKEWAKQRETICHETN